MSETQDPRNYSGTATLGRFGPVLGVAVLEPKETGIGFGIWRGFEDSKVYFLPASQILSVTPYCTLPFLAWGIQIRHTHPEFDQPIFFHAAVVKRRELIEAIAQFPYGRKEWKGLA